MGIAIESFGHCLPQRSRGGGCGGVRCEAIANGRYANTIAELIVVSHVSMLLWLWGEG
ncbi:MAG: hypothetical protein AAFX40_08915 [Cyanobacteria bacterium J06639_1]